MMRNCLTLSLAFVVGAAVVGRSTTASAGPKELIQTIKAVGAEGAGNADASAATAALSEQSVSVLPLILNGFDDANPLAANWLRSAFETIADRAIRAGGSLPQDKLLAFVQDTNRNARARRLAYEWLIKVSPRLEERVIPKMLLDPSAEFRRDAVARLINQAKKLTEEDRKAEATIVWKQALSGAVHDDQVKAIVEPLKELGYDVSLPEHFGFLTNWSLIGPFDNKDKKGFAVTYPPEKEIRLNAEYKGQLDDVRWLSLESDDDYGVMNIAEKIFNHKGSCYYATTEFRSDAERAVQFRLGTPNAWKLWVNGEKVFEREEYHRGERMDQYRVDVKLKPGRNRILLKICQNEQTEEWAQKYQYQLRVCDAAGSAVLSADRQQTSRVDRQQATVGGAE